MNESDHFVRGLRESLPERPRALMITSDPNDRGLTRGFSDAIRYTMEMSDFVFRECTIPDGRNQERTKDLVSASDLLIFQGDMCPRKTVFFRERIAGSNGLEVLNTACYYALFVTGVPALTALGHDHLVFSNCFSSFNAKISYVFYRIHFLIVIGCQYLPALTGMDRLANFFITLVIAYPLTWCLCLLIGKSKTIRVSFGMKKVF